MTRTFLIITLLTCIFGTASGCSLLPGFSPPEVVKHPDAPMLIMRVEDGYAKVAVYQKSTNSLTQYGWIDLTDSVGWTLTKYDWEQFIDKRSTNND